ncbi:MAG TPA: glutamate-1-semialdehyde 2,1-aminomutase [bacterium]|nr:glutamate-1-semialdehyde 2,1-aminomutase [bacterium]
MNHEWSEKFYKRAQDVLVAGAGASQRSFDQVGGMPIYMLAGDGARITDHDENVYLDYLGSNGPLILGHAHPQIVSTMKLSAMRGTTLGANSGIEVKLAKKIVELMPSIKKLRFVNSETEAAAGAVRLARGVTGRDKIIIFAGSDHGNADSFLVRFGVERGEAIRLGVPAGTAQDTLIADYNDLESVRKLFEKYDRQIAAVIVEPVASNMGVVAPVIGFLPGLRDQCSQHGALLIFDEATTGFRVAADGAQALFGVKPDLTCLGKIIGGGLPIGAFGGSAEIMDHLEPLGTVAQRGAISGNPMAMSVGLTVLDLLTESLYDELEQKSARLEEGLREAAAKARVDVQINRTGSMMSLFFTDRPVWNLTSARAVDVERFARFFHAMLEQAIYLPTSPWGAWFLSAAHTDEQVTATIQASGKAFKKAR